MKIVHVFVVVNFRCVYGTILNHSTKFICSNAYWCITIYVVGWCGHHAGLISRKSGFNSYNYEL